MTTLIGSRSDIPHDKDPWGQLTCEHPPRVILAVDNVLVPVISVETHVSRDGVSDKHYLSECHIPAEWDSRPVTSHIRQFNPQNQNRYSTATVYYQEPRYSGQYFAVQRGWVRGVGSSERATGVVKLYVDDISNLFSGVPIDATYDNANIEDILGDVAGKIRSETIFTDLEIRSPTGKLLEERDPDEVAVDRTAFGPAAGFWLALNDVDPVRDVQTFKTFKKNRASLDSVMSWITELTNAEWWISVLPDGETPVLVFDETPQSRTFADEETEVSETAAPIWITELNALEEISPYNTAQVYGSSKASVFGFVIKELESSSFPSVTVEYPDLVRRTGQSLQPPVYEIDATTLEQAENVARKKLLEQLQQSGEGDVHFTLRPDVLPGDKIVSLPVCKDAAPNTDLTPTSFEVEGLTHTVEESTTAITRANVSVWVDREKITTVEKGMRDT